MTETVGSPEIELPPSQSRGSSFLFFTMVLSFFTYLFILSHFFLLNFPSTFPHPPLEASCSYIRPEIQPYKLNGPCPFGESECRGWAAKDEESAGRELATVEEESGGRGRRGMVRPQRLPRSTTKYLGSQSLLRKTSPAAGRAQSTTAESDHTQAFRTVKLEPHSKPKLTTTVVFF